MLIIAVTFEVKPEHRDSFHDASIADGRASTSNEPGCLRFDVYGDPADPNKFMFVEVYKDDEAFNAHMQTPHFAAWREATQDALAGPPTVGRYTNIFPTDADWK